jgi:hypothetical protein
MVAIARAMAGVSLPEFLKLEYLILLESNLIRNFASN